MYLATKIKMKPGCYNSNELVEIDEIFISGADPYQGYHKKEYLHDYLQINPHTIQVDIPPYPYAIPATSSKGERYVRSSPNGNPNDNLLKLPREY